MNLLEAGFPGPSLVWSVRAAEILMRDLVLAPHFMLQKMSWERSMKQAAKVLGTSNWAKAFQKAEDWFGPFDEPLTTDERNAWKAWDQDFVRLRGDVVHGRSVHDVTAEEARAAHGYSERMSTWYAQRFLTSANHPIGTEFRGLLEKIVELNKAEAANQSSSAGPATHEAEEHNDEESE